MTLTIPPAVKTLLRFLVVGSAGALLNLLVTWALTTFIFGIAHYFYAYLIGVAMTLIFNFVAYTYTVFTEAKPTPHRFAAFIIWNLLMAYVQAQTVHFLTPRIGVQFYLLVIAGVIIFFALANYLASRFLIFRKPRASIQP